MKKHKCRECGRIYYKCPRCGKIEGLWSNKNCWCNIQEKVDIIVNRIHDFLDDLEGKQKHPDIYWDEKEKKIVMKNVPNK